MPYHHHWRAMATARAAACVRSAPRPGSRDTANGATIGGAVPRFVPQLSRVCELRPRLWTACRRRGDARRGSSNAWPDRGYLTRFPRSLTCHSFNVSCVSLSRCATAAPTNVTAAPLAASSPVIQRTVAMAKITAAVPNMSARMVRREGCSLAPPSSSGFGSLFDWSREQFLNVVGDQ